MLSALVLGALALAPGIPIALVVGRATRWSSVAVEGLVLGLCWWLLLGLTFSHAGWYDRWQVVLPTVVLVAVLSHPARRVARRVQRPRPTWFAGAMTAVTVAALVVRREPFYFIFQIGDFGEYVNRANAVADGRGFIGWFTQGFTVALSLTHLALGEARTVDLMPFLGIVLLVVTVELAARLGASPWARIVVAVVLAFGVAPVWFSRFPASETLYAVLQVGMVLLVVLAVQRESTALAVAAGAVCGLLLVTRGNGILVAPIVVVTVFVSALVVRRRSMDVLSVFLASALLSLGAAFVFNARFSHPYFIAEQLPKFVPDPIFRHLEGMGGLRFAAPRLVVLVVVTAALVVGVRRLHTAIGPGHDRAGVRLARRSALPVLVAVAVIVLLTVLDPAGLVDALVRDGVVVEVLGGIGIAVALWRFADGLGDDERVAAVLVVLTSLSFLLLYAERLPEPRYAPYFLYWDRYLFSEVLPLLVLAAIWAVWLVERSRLPTPVIGVAALVVGGLLYQGGAVTRERVFMDDAYAQLRAVDELLHDDDRQLLFAGVRPEDMPLAICHPNTHRIVASPLAATFGRRFLNLGLRPYAADPQPDAIELARVMAAADVEDAYLLQVAVGDRAADPIVSGGLTVAPVGATTLVIPLLDRPLDPSTVIEGDPIAGCARSGTPTWREATFTISVSRVTR